MTRSTQVFRNLSLIFFCTSVGWGCNSFDEAQRQQVTHLTSGMARSLGGGMTSKIVSTGALEEVSRQAPISVLDDLRNQVRGMVWSSFFSQKNYSLHPGNASGVEFAATTCATDISLHCKSSCPNAKTWQISCLIPDGSTESCTEEVFLFSRAHYDLSIDISSMTESASTLGGIVRADLSMTANVTGGKLDGKQLVCMLAMTVDYTKLWAGEESFEPLADGFSCTYDENPIAFDVFKTSLQTDAACT